MSTLYLVRHGQASFGAANYDQLSELGYRQAEAVGAYFARTGVTLDAAYSGDLSRQRETCERVIAAQPGAVPHGIDPRFNEIDNDGQVRAIAPLLAAEDPAFKALLDGGVSSSKQYQKLIEAVFGFWVDRDCSGLAIQPWAEYNQQAVRGLRELMKEQGAGKTVALFTSGGTIATLVAHVLGLTGRQVYALYEPVFNCSVTQLFYNGDRVSLSYFNDRSALQWLGDERGEELVSYR